MNGWMTIATGENVSFAYFKEYPFLIFPPSSTSRMAAGQLISIVVFTLPLKTRVAIVGVGLSPSMPVVPMGLVREPLSRPWSASSQPASPSCSLLHFFLLCFPHLSTERQERRATYFPWRLTFWLWFLYSRYHLLSISLSSSLADCFKFLWFCGQNSLLYFGAELCFWFKEKKKPKSMFELKSIVF